jgi:hypothetical protein
MKKYLELMRDGKEVLRPVRSILCSNSKSSGRPNF